LKYWEIIADNLHKAGFILDWVSGLDLEGQTIWIVDAHGYGKRFIVRSDEKLTAFLELESPPIPTGRNVGRCPTFFVDRVLGFSAGLSSR
jgi:hypothetical protein